MEWRKRFKGDYVSECGVWKVEHNAAGWRLDKRRYVKGRYGWESCGVFGSLREAKEFARKAKLA